MLTAVDPCDSTGSMHLAIRELECECKFLYNFNCRPDCPNRTPTNAPGKKKGKKEKEAYEKARIEFRNDAETKLGLRIGTLTTVLTSKYFLSILFYKSILRVLINCSNSKEITEILYYTFVQKLS